MNSRAKGCRGEREFRDVLRAMGFLKAHRGQQFCGLKGNADVVCPEIPWAHFEVKRVQRGNPYDWVAQARHDAKGKTPIVAHKRNHSEWLAVLPMDALLEIVVRGGLIGLADREESDTCQSQQDSSGSNS